MLGFWLRRIAVYVICLYIGLCSYLKESLSGRICPFCMFEFNKTHYCRHRMQWDNNQKNPLKIDKFLGDSTIVEIVGGRWDGEITEIFEVTEDSMGSPISFNCPIRGQLLNFHWSEVRLVEEIDV